METTAALETTAFYVVGIVLVVLALITAAIGLRYESFPGSRAVLAAGIAVFVVAVGATGTAAVINARHEQEKRQNEQAAEAAEEEAVEAEEAGESLEEVEKQLSAPADGTLAFNTDALQAEAGEVTIRFDNPAAIEHDVAIEHDGAQIAKSDLVSEGETTVSAELEPGEYVFYCSVPGHREGGMEGTLTVE